MMVLVYDGKLKVSLESFLKFFSKKEEVPSKDFTSLFVTLSFLSIS